MKVLILGIDGYLGWSLAMDLINSGHEVAGIDNFIRRKLVIDTGSMSATPIKTIFERIDTLKKITGKEIQFWECDLLSYSRTETIIKRTRPDAIVHFAEIPSAPYSMKGVDECQNTMMNNINGTLNVLYAIKDHVPDCHLVKLGTMGEYGTPNIDIPEGFFEINFRGRKAVLPFPKDAGSFYHLTKVHDSENIRFANKIWNITATDIMQGVVHGIKTWDQEHTDLLTRFDFDHVFGTALNRFVASALINEPMYLYGSGTQRRGFIALRDSMQCIKLILENPQPETYRVINQFDEHYSIQELALIVQTVAYQMGFEYPMIKNIWNNPRVELEKHHYNPDTFKLKAMGFKPEQSLEDEIKQTFQELIKYKDRIGERRDLIYPKIRWRD